MQETGLQTVLQRQAEKAVLAIWNFFRFVCDLRLVSIIRDNLDTLSEHQRFRRLITGEVKAKLAKVSRSTVERMLTGERKRRKTKGIGSAKPGTLLKQQIAVRIFWQ
jgi:hypothetical protein